MDVGRKSDYRDLSQRHLLFGVVTYASGKLGKEPIRSQGHIHAISASTNYSTAEVYEIWKGHCIVLMQETADDDPGRVFAVSGKVGDVIVVPPGWAHMTINADSSNSMTFGAWCIRNYGFEYGAVRQHHGLAYYPFVADSGGIEWEPNPHYNETSLIVKKARQYDDLGITADVSIYEQYRENKDAFDFVTRPTSYLKIWKGFEP
jgi:glucose-6-phosphate isomerase